jgi:pyruvate/2-oxoglutarate dehydrogenase complex dihydrolipoamide dehydrogenase (E3) component
MTETYDLIVIGAGSGGITAAQFGQKLGARVALVEKERIGGDCTWTGCVPSKALLKVAKVAYEARQAGLYGLNHSGPPQTDMGQVRAYLRRAIAEVHQHETAAALSQEGLAVICGAAHFIDPYTIQAGERTLTAKKFIIASGAQPLVPPIPGLSQIPYHTYRQIFDNDQLPDRLLIIGAGPIGVELGQAYQRLGAQVTLIDIGLLPAEAPEVAAVLGQVFATEGLHFVQGLVSVARQEGAEISLTVAGQEVCGQMVLLAVGRAPNVTTLDLERAGVRYSAAGIPVDKYLRTNRNHIFAVGDCVAGNDQFTHVAAWQGVKAAQNALLPFYKAPGLSRIIPRTIFTDPEVAQVGLSEVEARAQIGAGAMASLWPIERIDRAVTDNDRAGFVKVIHKKNGQVLGATIVAGWAGELISEFALAIQHGLKLLDLANVIHPYPTYAIATQQLAGQVALETILASPFGKVIRAMARLGW